MELVINLLALCISVIAIFITLNLYFRSQSSNKKKQKNLPPSPPSIPLIGHLHLLSLPIHHAFSKFSRQLGPTFLLRFGSRPALIVSTPSAIHDCYATNDVIFSSRPRVPSFKNVSYGYTTFGTAPYGPHWRNHRKLANSLLFSPNRLHYLSQVVISEEVSVMVRELFKDGCKHHDVNGFKEVKFLSKVYRFTINIIMRALAGKRCFGDDEQYQTEEVLEQGRKFYWILEEFFELTRSGNPDDYLPFLRWIGFKTNHKRYAKLGDEMDAFITELVEEQSRKTTDKEVEGNEENNLPVIDSLLRLQETEGAEIHSNLLIKGMIQTILLGSAHSAALSVEWTMAVLVNHPDIMQKVTKEIKNVVGTNRVIADTDLSNLPYLRNVIKESLRLYPIGPILLPRESTKDCIVSGFHIPCGTILLTNAYELHRNAEFWDEPAEFKPERFEKIDAKDLERIYFPFGSGRRGCPGEYMAIRKISLGLGALLQCFEWKRNGEKLVDMTEGAGLSMGMANNLVVKYKARDDFVHVLSQI